MTPLSPPAITVEPPTPISTHETPTEASVREAGVLIARSKNRPLHRPSAVRQYDYSPHRRGQGDNTVAIHARIDPDLQRAITKLRPLCGGVYETEGDCLADAAFQWAQAMHTDIGARLPEIESYISAERSRRASEWNARQARLAETELHNLTITLVGILIEGDLEEAAREIERVWATWSGLSKTFWQRRQCRLFAASPIIRASVRVLTIVAGFTLSSDLVAATRGVGN